MTLRPSLVVEAGRLWSWLLTYI